MEDIVFEGEIIVNNKIMRRSQNNPISINLTCGSALSIGIKD